MHANARRKKITLLSIPRDLYYKGLRINAYHRLYGINQLARELTEITGLKISFYVTIDMFALIEVINILEGIYITLEKNLVDPTYRIKREDSTWGTLYYPKGSYQLNGIQALRIARSRYTTSDFDRAKRQQLVLKAMADKLKNLAFLDIDKVYMLIKTLAAYVETDLSIFEMFHYYLKYKDYAIDTGNVIDTTNVLYHTFSNIYLLEDQDVDEDFDKGKYILLPHDNDWNLIRWYFRTLIDTP